MTIPKVTHMRNGRFVEPFDWPAAQALHGGEPFATIATAYAALNDLADASQAKHRALAQDPNFTEAGRLAQIRDWFAHYAAPVLKRGRDAAATAARSVEEIRSRMKGNLIDKSDIAAAMLRSETRTWLRGLDPAKRNAMIRMGVEPAVALAIVEAPAELSGVSEEQRARIDGTSVAALHPAEVSKIEAITAASDALISAERAAMLTLQDATGYGNLEFAEALGGPTLSDRINAILGGGEGESGGAAA